MTDNTKREIINSLIEGTKNGTFVWSLTNSLFNSDSSKEYSVMSADGETKFDTKVELDGRTLQFKSNSPQYFVMYNKRFIDGKMWISGSDFPTELTNLQKLLYETYTKATIVYKDEDAVLNDILGVVGDKATRREKKIDSVLGSIKSKLWF